jgi:uncharacterized protein YcbX
VSAVARIESLHTYPVKSCRGLSLTDARLGSTGFEHDREWLVVNGSGKFLTQREVPRLALVETQIIDGGVRLSAHGAGVMAIPNVDGPRRRVTVWRDTVEAIDGGDAVAAWLSDFVRMSVRLVRFAPDSVRLSSQEWTGSVESPIFFSDGYPILAISTSSLDDLNARLPPGAGPLPMNRFRPNMVISGIDAYAEDRIDELRAPGLTMRVVKPCTRCKITTTDQATAEVMGEEPLTTLRSYRWDARLKGVTFGQNVIAVDSLGATLRVGQTLQVTWK